MGVTSLKYLSSIQLGAGASIYELEDATPSSEVEELVGMSAGFPEPLWRGVKGMKPRIKFSTPQLGTMLGVFNAGAGAPYVADQSAGNTDLWYQDATNLGGRTSAASTAHQRFRATKACAYWTKLSAKHQDDAKIDCELLPIFDGTNPPLAAAGSLALTGAPIGNERYTLGPVKINGTLLGGLQEATLNSGVKANEEGSDGDLYLTWVGLDTTNPILELTGRTIEWWNTYGPVTAISSITLFLLQKSATGNWANTNTPAKHIAITGTAGTIIADSVSGKKASTKLKIGFAAPSASSSSLTVVVGANVS
jgi:hypothetical protein